MQYLVTFCSRPDRDSDVISSKLVGPIVYDTFVKFRDPRLNRSPEIPPEAVGDVVFDRSNDVMSGVLVDTTGMDVP